VSHDVFNILLSISLCSDFDINDIHILQLMGMLFVTRNWTQDEAKIERMFKTIKRYEAPVWIVNFLEGTRATPQKLKDVCICQKKVNRMNTLIIFHVVIWYSLQLESTIRSKEQFTCIEKLAQSANEGIRCLCSTVAEYSCEIRVW